MTDIQVVKFENAHLEQISPKKVHDGEIPKRIVQDAVTFLVHGSPVAIFGAFYVIEGVMHIWGLVSEAVRKVPFQFHRLCDRLITYYENSHGVRRVQMDVKTTYPDGRRWAELLGFRCEGVMRAFTLDGCDSYLMARTRICQQ